MPQTDKKLNALLELERRAMTGDKSITPEVKSRIDRELQAYRAQGAAKPLVGNKGGGNIATLRALEDQINRVESLYKSGPGATSGVMGALDYLPTPTNKQFDAASAGIGDVAFNAFRTPGAGAQSDAELKARLAATQPSSSDYDNVIEEKLNYLRTRLDAAYEAMGVKRAAPSDDDLVNKYLRD